MVRGFKDFLLRGNIVDLAVAVVIGTAFVALVTAFTESFIDPLLAAAGGGAVGEGLGFRLRGDDPATFLDIGAFLTAVVGFCITAAVVYFAVVVPMQKVTARLRQPGEDAAITDTALLTEIRDLLAAQSPGGTAGGRHCPTRLRSRLDPREWCLLGRPVAPDARPGTSRARPPSSTVMRRHVPKPLIVGHRAVVVVLAPGAD